MVPGLLTIKSSAWKDTDFRYFHHADEAACWVRRKQPGAADSDADDHDRTVLLVTAIEGTPEAVAGFLAKPQEDLDWWAEFADCELRRDHDLPERGQVFDSNALHDPAPLNVELAEGLQ